MSRRRRRERPHGLDWHEQQLAKPWLNYSVLDDQRRPVRPLTPREYEREVQRAIQQMQAHDQQPPRLRELVREHNINRGIELYRAELLAAPRCPHGRIAASCAQCTYQRAQEARRTATGRDGTELTRKAAPAVAELLARRRRAD